jgi:RNA polymerase sigma factor (sigma-70 family)
MRRGIEHLLRSADAPNPERAEGLWAEYRAGGPAADGAFATLLAWYGGPLYRRIWGFVRSDAADDLFQDVLARLHRERGRLATFAEALRWVRAVAVTHCIDAHRRATRREARERARAVPEGAEDASAVRLDLNEALRVGLARLSAREQQAVALVFFEGLTRQDAAAVAGVHRDTFAKTLDGALARLRAALAVIAVGTAATTASLEAALSTRPAFATHLRLAELAAAAWGKPPPPLSVRVGGWLTRTRLLVGLAVLSVSLVTGSLLMPVAPKTRLGVERLEPRDNPSGGVLDTTFSTGGIATVPRIDTGGVNAVATQPDGKVLTVGTVVNSKPWGISVTRLNTDGTPDATFGTNGTATVGPAKATNNHAYGFAVAVQPDGKILAAGRAYTKSKLLSESDSEFAVVRLNANGTLDKSFGGANTGWWEYNPTAGDEIAWKLAVVPKVGGFSIYVGGQTGTAAAVVKLTSDGRPDTTYGVGGVARQASTDRSFIGSFHCQLAVTPSGRAVVYTDSSKLYGFTPAGQADTGFGTGGAVSVSFTVNGLAAQGERVVAAGTYQVAVPYHGVVTRYTPAGAVDTTFGTGGVFVGPSIPGAMATYFGGLAVTGDGSLAIVGTVNRKDEAGVVHRGILLGRLSADGQPDATFGPAPDGSGLVFRYDQNPDISLSGLTGAGSAIAVDSDGNIFVGGSQSISSTSSNRVVLRFTGH